MTDKYINFKELSQENTEGKDYVISLNNVGSPILILAPHGGKIEPTTSEITRKIAGDKFSYYCFEGKKTNRKGELHITSTNFDEPKCLKLVAQSEIIITIHGKAGAGERIFMGGKNKTLSDQIKAALLKADFNIEDETNPNLMARNKDNICNKGNSGNGVQLEIEKGLRDRLKTDQELIACFCSTIQMAIIKI